MPDPTPHLEHSLGLIAQDLLCIQQQLTTLQTLSSTPAALNRVAQVEAHLHLALVDLKHAREHLRALQRHLAATADLPDYTSFDR